jgi:hypothetical protein
MASNTVTLRGDLQSNVTTLRDTAITFTGIKTFQNDVILESNLRVQGDLLVANTINMTVSDPILELGSNNQNTGDIGLVMTRHGTSNSNVAVFFDETADALKLGYTLNGANDTTLEFDSNALAVSVQGALAAASVSGDGSGLTSLNAGNVSSGTLGTARIPNLDAGKITSGTLTRPISTTTGTFSGDVGIGTTSPSSTLHVNLGNASGEQHIRATQTSLASSTAGIRFGDSTWDAFIDHSHGGKDLMNFGFYRNPTRQVNMVLTHEGNLGIGTTSPGRALEVYTGNGNTPGLRLRRYPTGAAYTDLRHADSPDGLAIHTSDGNSTTLEVMRICGANGGRVGIGTTDPTEILHLAADANPQILVEDTGSANRSEIRFKTATTDWCLGQHGGDTGKFKIANNTDVGTGTLVTIDQSGNVGIGTTNPQDKLHIYGTDSQLFQIQNTNDTARMVLNGASGTGGDLIFRQNGTSTWGIASIGDKLHFLGDDSTSQYRMTLDNSGNVGIGTTSPGYKLHVSGDINFTGTLYQNGTAFSGGGGGSSVWSTSGSNIYYNTGNVGIGTANPSTMVCIDGGTGVGSSGGVLGIRQKGNTMNDGITLTSSHSNSVRMYKDASGHFHLYNTGGGQFTLQNGNGNVGIGTTSPSERLQIQNGNILITGTWTPGTYYRIMGYNTAKQIQFNYNDGIWISDNNKILFGVGGSQDSKGIYDERMRITNTGVIVNNELLVTTTNGNSATGYGVSMRTNANQRWTWAPGTDNWLRLYGDGQSGNTYGSYRAMAVGNFWSAGATRFSSDDRVKHFEEEIPECLELIKQLKPYKYKKTSKIYTENYTGEIGEEGKDWDWEIGLIAQDIKKIPYLEFSVTNPDTTPEGKYGLNYTIFIGVCIQGIKDLSNKLSETRTQLEQALQTEKEKTKTLESRLAFLETAVASLIS